MEIKGFHVFELGLGGREQLFTHPYVRVHGATDIKKQQHFYCIVAFRHHFNIEKTGVAGRRGNSVAQIQLIGGTLAGKFTQPPQRHLDVADTQLNIVIQVFVVALLPDFYGFFVPRFALFNADAFGVITIGTKGRRAAGADHFVTALMTFVLFFQTFFKLVQHFIQATQRFNFGHIFRRHQALKLFAHPVGRNVGFGHAVRQGFEATEVTGKGLIELVVMAFVFHQAQPRQSVKLIQIGKGDMGFHGFNQIQILAH